MNLNSFKDKKIATKSDILENISDLDIYRRYTQKEVKFAIQKSPLRKDRNPSFGFFIKNKEILFNDYVLGGGDCIRFVQKMFNLNYNQAISKIVLDFNLDNKFLCDNTIKKTPNNIDFTRTKEDILNSKENVLIGKRSRRWNINDKNYWTKYNISLKTLKEYNVEPIDYLFINDQPYKTDKLAYCYIERKDDIETYKIYQPYSKSMKWLTNHDYSVWQGWNQLPDKNENLIITKSLKDVMCIVSISDIPAVALQNEQIKPKQHIIDELRKRFKNIYLLYDNDWDKEKNWGKKFSKKLCKEYNFIEVCIPDEYKSTDISDLIVNKNVDIAKYELWKQIEQNGQKC